ncbi:hypothetical protein PHYPO_G00127560 [Pangasianodon hypophthalmus]|uniref:Uncharacterized protein n=1 Tax=Pangasianodon hypophthalmus TaxID=310915 RepID=A0A5N5KRP3_PANHP|nr:hypothetical protein PHYPO_G00127560 [Pangasianodon hypophthalmus]
MMEDVKALMRFQNRRPAFTVGSVGPYNIQVQSLNTLMEDSKVSDEVMDSVCNVLSKVGKKDVPPNVLQQPTKAKTKRGRQKTLPWHWPNMPKEKLLTGIPKEDIPAILRSIERMKMNLQNLGPESELDLATHRFGPTAADVVLSFLGNCMK